MILLNLKWQLDMSTENLGLEIKRQDKEKVELQIQESSAQRLSLDFGSVQSPGIFI